ncbi:MAG: hypothetical protein KDH20_07380 [Rhodocyclaceae bacterium]|nr:hypothetical protein [Rhodocyclaceae bacterium]
MFARLTTLAAAVAGLALAQPALALDVPIELEGTIENIIPADDSITVMGITVTVPRTANITTPTANINQVAADIGASIGRPNVKPLVLLRRFRDGGADVLPAQLPGRNQVGFLGATTTIVGSATINDVTGAIESITATDVFVEPAENVILGALISASCTTPMCDGAGDSISMLGTPSMPVSDPRIPTVPPTNEFGFGIDLSLVASPIPGSVGGYYGDDAAMHYHTLILDVGTAGTELLNQGAEVAIDRASCRDRGGELEIEIRGAVHDPADGTVSFADPASGFLLGTVDTDVVIDEVTNLATRFGTFRFRADVNDPAGLGCPTSVVATALDGGGVTTTAPMTID